MNTIDRIHSLLMHYRLMRTVHMFNLTDVLNDLDEAAGIETTWRDNHCCTANGEDSWECSGDHNHRRYVGARVALHEEHLARTDRKQRRIIPGMYFYLGAEAETVSV